MMYDRECLYDVEWQRIRICMLGTWDTPEHVRKNITDLMMYCDDAMELSNAGDLHERIVRCTNYFAAILLGYGSKTMFEKERELVKNAHTLFMRRMVPSTKTSWDWTQVEHDLRKADYTFLKALWNNLQKRVYTSTKRTGGTQHRPELMKFLGLLQSEFAYRGVDVTGGRKP